MFKVGDVVTSDEEVFYTITKEHTVDGRPLFDMIRTGTTEVYQYNKLDGPWKVVTNPPVELITAYGREFIRNVRDALDNSGIKYKYINPDGRGDIRMYTVPKKMLAKAKKAVDDHYMNLSKQPINPVKDESGAISWLDEPEEDDA